MDASSQRKILIVDDLPANRMLLTKIFSSEYNIVEASDGLEALTILREQHDIDIMLLDIMMPNMDGYEVLERIKSDSTLPSVSVLIISAHDDEGNQIRALDLGAVDLISKPFNPKIILHRVKNVIKRIDAENIKTQNKLYQQKLDQQREFIRLSEIDRNTGIYNKIAFCRYASELLKNNPSKKYIIVRWDIDRFKVFNDIYGTNEGDKLLRKIGEKVSKSVPSGCAYAHLDADHFIICVEKSGFDVESFITILRNTAVKAYSDFEFILRAGIYVVDTPELDVEIMCDRALLALRSVKGTYSARYAYYDESMRNSIIEEQRIITETAFAIENGQFTIYFQPQYNYAENKLTGAEALVRWIHPKDGLIPPNKFIPVLERNGLITALDEFVWELACKHLRRWIDAGIEPVPISVNISRVDIYNPKLCSFMRSLIKKYNISSHLLHLEITESAYMDNSAQLISVVEQLQKSGFIVEMDDFGSGFSSLNTLKDVPVDILKLDFKFLKDDISGSRGGNILSSVIRMAHWLKLPVIAEGIETQQHADYLKSIGCLLMQGYYFARPMPPEQFDDMLLSSKKDLHFDKYSKTNIEGAADFWDAAAQTTLLFNSFVGGAAIIEYTGDRVELIRTNDKYFEVLRTTRTKYFDRQKDLLDRFDPNSRDTFIKMLEKCIETGGEAFCEIVSRPLERDGLPFWTLTRARFLAKNIDSYIFYLSIENITERHNLMQRNTELSEHLSSIISSVPGGIVTFDMTDTLKIVYCNDKTAEMFGYTKEEYLSKFAESPLAVVHPAEKDQIERIIMEHIYSDKEVITERYRHICKDNSYKWVQMTAHIMRNQGKPTSTSAILLDINEKVASEKFAVSQALELENQRAFLQSLYDSVPCSIMQYVYENGEYKLISYNDASWKIFKYSSRAEYEKASGGLTLKDIHPDDMSLVFSGIKEVTHNSEHVDFENRIVCTDGSIRWINTFLHRIVSENSSVIIQSVFYDITDQKEREIQKYSNTLYALFDEVVEVDYGKNTAVVLFSKNGFESSGNAGKDFKTILKTWSNKYVVDEDRDKFNDFMRPIKNDASGKTRILEYCILLPNGRRHAIRTNMINIGEEKYMLCNCSVSNEKQSDA